MHEILLAPILLLIIWYWWGATQCKEAARRSGKQACTNAGVQFLDDTVEQKKVWFRRSENGRLQMCRLFIFEFTSDGAQRYQGRIIILGNRVAEVEMDAYRI